MNESLTTKKTEAQVSAQIGRISRKLADRAAKLPPEMVEERSRHDGDLYVSHTGGEDPLYEVAYNNGASHSAVGNLFVTGQHGASIERFDNESRRDYHVTVNADRGKIEGFKESVYPTDEELMDTHGSIKQELPPEEATHQAAKALNHLRGAVAEREIEADKK